MKAGRTTFPPQGRTEYQTKIAASTVVVGEAYSTNISVINQ